MSSADFALPSHLGNDVEAKSLADYLDIVRRRRTTLLLVTAGLFVCAAAVALLMPAVYRSSATILIQEQEIPQELVRSTITSYADERIQVISQQVLTRATLLDLVAKHDLYAKDRSGLTNEEILERMRRDIMVTPISADVTDRRSGSQVRATIAFKLSYDSEVAANAQRVASELTTLFLNENLKIRQTKAAETTSFLDTELQRVSEHISDLEQQLADFKRRHQGRTPDRSLANLVERDRAEAEIQRLDRELAFVEDRKRSLETQLAETPPQPLLTGGAVLEPADRLRLLQTQLASMSAVYSDSHPDVRRVRREIEALQAEVGPAPEVGDRQAALDRLGAQLGLLRQRYSDEHPDVVKLQRTYEALARAVRSSASRTPGDGRPPTNPAYITLRGQIETIEAQIDAMRAERRAYEARQADASDRLAQTPEVEREFLELARDLDISRASFRDLRAKQMQAQVAEELERSRKAERFTIIEPAIYPERPYRPNRPVIFLMGAVLAVIGGMASVALREALDDTVHGGREVSRVLQVPVLAVVPATPGPRALRRRRVRRRLYVALALGGVVASAALIHWLVVPLDVAWYSLLRRAS